MKKKSDFEAEQIQMLQKLQILLPTQSIALQPGSKIITLDVQYQGEWGFVGMDVLEWGTKESQVMVTKALVQAEYEPGFFAFREGPIILAAVEKLIQSKHINPALLIIDGHGTAHPRKMGLASWVGINRNIPSIGIAKESLLKINYTLAESAGSTFEIIEAGAVIGTVLRTQDGIKPVFVSAGHLISQSESVRIIKELRGEYRHIEPIRRADHAARQYAKGVVEKAVIEC